MSRVARPLLDRVSEKFVIDEHGCWLWTGYIGEGGYGRVYEGHSDGRTLMAHRVVYELAVGPIPEGLTLDHLCRVRCCVNPDHVEPVTLRENLLRGETSAAINAAKTRCIHGHAFTPENTYVYADGRRTCRRCIRDRARERMRRVRAEARAALARAA